MTDTDGAIPAVVLEAIEGRRAAGDRVVFTNGCFDLLHPGHVNSLRAARDQGDLLVVGVNSDSSVCDLKGSGRPVIPATARADILRELRCVDYVVVFDGPTPIDLIWELRPDVYVKGADWRDRPMAEADAVREQGGAIAFIDLVSEYSTTAIIDSIRAVRLDDGKTPDAE